MQVFAGNFAVPTGTGNKSFTGVGFQPSVIRFEIAKKGSSDTTNNMSNGIADGTRQSTRSIFRDSTGAATEKTNTKCISHLGRPSSSIVPVLQASFVSFDTDGFTLNFDTIPATTTDYQINAQCLA